MKKIFVAAAAALTLASSLAIVPAVAQDRGGGQSERYQTGQGRADRAQDDRARDERAQEARSDRRDSRGRRQAWRDHRREARWDDARHNGYYVSGRWYYGPPRADIGRGRTVQLGYKPWARGQRLGYYSNRYAEVDYRSVRDYRGRSLRAPPRGYHWVRDDGGDYLLAAIASGIIAQVILSGNNSRY